MTQTTTDLEERFKSFKATLMTIAEYPITSALENMDAYNLKVIAERILKKDKEIYGAKI